MKRLHHLLWVAGLATIVLLFDGCTTIPQQPATTNSPTVFTIPAPENFNACFLRHQTSGASTAKIEVMVDVRTVWSNGGALVETDDVKVALNPNTNPFPVQVSALCPTDRPIYVEVNIQGKYCSECASGKSVDGPAGNQTCLSVVTSPTTNPLSYLAATPRWQRKEPVQSYASSKTLGVADQITNLPNSCNCVVN